MRLKKEHLSGKMDASINRGPTLEQHKLAHGRRGVKNCSFKLRRNIRPIQHSLGTANNVVTLPTRLNRHIEVGDDIAVFALVSLYHRQRIAKSGVRHAACRIQCIMATGLNISQQTLWNPEWTPQHPLNVPYIHPFHSPSWPQPVAVGSIHKHTASLSTLRLLCVKVVALWLLHSRGSLEVWAPF